MTTQSLPPTLDQIVQQVANTDAVAASTQPDEFDKLVESLKDNVEYKYNSMYMPIVLREDYVEVDLGNHLKKNISYGDFRNIISKTIHDRSEVEVPGLLPPSNLIFFSQNAKQVRLSCYYPTAIRPLIYGDSTLQVTTPNIIISHVLNKDGKDWIVASTKYFCTDQPINKLPKTFINEADPTKRIFINPLSNTYADARMCYGHNTMPMRFKDDNLRGLDYYYRFLWESAFNNDLGIVAIRNSDGVAAWYKELAKATKDKTAFPYDRLRNWVAHPDGLSPVVPQ